MGDKDKWLRHRGYVVKDKQLSLREGVRTGIITMFCWEFLSLHISWHLDISIAKPTVYYLQDETQSVH